MRKLALALLVLWLAVASAGKDGKDNGKDNKNCGPG